MCGGAAELEKERGMWGPVSQGPSVVCFRIVRVLLDIVTSSFSPILDLEPLTVGTGLTLLSSVT